MNQQQVMIYEIINNTTEPDAQMEMALRIRGTLKGKKGLTTITVVRVTKLQEGTHKLEGGEKHIVRMQKNMTKLDCIAALKQRKTGDQISVFFEPGYEFEGGFGLQSNGKDICLKQLYEADGKTKIQ